MQNFIHTCLRHIKFILMITLHCVCAFLSAQEHVGNNNIDSLFRKILPTQEKIYLHFDNNWYVTGDTIWYKAYVVRADNNRVSPLSRILYVELLDQQGFLKERQKIIIDYNGQGNGQFHIPDSAFCGYYEVRAYTKWMMNFGYEHIYPWWKLWTSKFNGNGMRELTNKSFYEPGVSNPMHTKEVESLEQNVSGEIAPLPENPTQKTTSLGHPIIENDEEMEAAIKQTIFPDVMRRNFRDYYNLFSRVLPVYQKPDSAHHFRRKIMPMKVTMGDYHVSYNAKDFRAAFYPEGGELLEGHFCRVGWEVYNKEERRMNVSGLLLGDGEIIDTIKPLHGGRGVIEFFVKKGADYKAEFMYDGKKHTVSLPKPKKTGARIFVKQTNDSVIFHIGRNGSADKRIFLSLTCRGKFLKAFPLTFDNGETIRKVHKKWLPSGVCQATVFDEFMTIYADRLFFIRNDSTTICGTRISGFKNAPYQPKEKINLEISLTNCQNEPLNGQTFSLAVRDADQCEATFATGNAMTELLLQSEIKGFVENPEFYFSSNDRFKNEALDNLLMIQGWRRYKWEDTALAENFKPDFQPEQTTTIAGRAYDLRSPIIGKKTSTKEIFCSLRKTTTGNEENYFFQGKMSADSTGRFHFSYPPFYGNAKLVLRGKYEAKINKRKYKLIPHDENIFIAKEYFFPQTMKTLSWYEVNQPDAMPKPGVSWEEYENDIYQAVVLPEVKIKNKYRPHIKRQRDKAVVNMDFLDYINDMWDTGYYDIFYKLSNKEYPLLDVISHLLFYTRHRYTAPDERLILSFNWKVNQVKWTIEHGNFLPIFKAVSIVTDDPRRPVNYELVHLDRRTEMKAGLPPYGVSGYINLETFPNDSTRLISGREYNFPGFNQPAEFYNPDYSNATLPDIKDYRKTLYWNPNVTTDENGKAVIEFYNNSVATEIQVSVEGITKDGKFIVHE